MVKTSMSNLSEVAEEEIKIDSRNKSFICITHGEKFIQTESGFLQRATTGW